MTEEQKIMMDTLTHQKQMVISKLIKGLSHSNRGNIEVSLNACTVLVELVEIDKTFELFFANDSQFIRKLVELAIDPSNAFN